MPKEMVIDQFLDSLEKFYTFLRPHSPRPFVATREIADIKENDKVTLDMWHFSALIIISILTDKGARPCHQKDVRQIFLWKYHGRENKFNDQNNGALNVLESCNFIVRQRAKQGSRQNNEIRLTADGVDLVNELREYRKQDVRTILSHLGVRDETRYPYEKIGDALTNLADELWAVVLEDASGSAKKPSSRKSKKSGQTTLDHPGL